MQKRCPPPGRIVFSVCSRLKVKSDLLETMNFEFPYYHPPPVDDSDLSLLGKENGRLPEWKAAGYQLPIPN
jgi:hypothetical protein